jgi:hypothetical protein
MCGDGTVITPRLTPVPVITNEVLNGLTITQLYVGYSSSSVICDNNLAYGWGRGGFGAIGDGTGVDRNKPVAVSGGYTFAFLSSGFGMHTCGYTLDSKMYCWGYNGFKYFYLFKILFIIIFFKVMVKLGMVLLL